MDKGMEMIKNNDIDILMEFLNFPQNESDEIFKKFATIPGAMEFGKGDKKSIYITGTRKDKVLLIAHADTVSKNYQKQNLIIENNIIKNTNGIIGADDRSGCAILWLLKDLGHSILITNGEEKGCKGSRYLMDRHYNIFEDLNQHQFMVEFDSRGSTDFKTYFVGSNDFDKYINKSIGYKKVNGKYTDICVLCETICGVNLSVGYYNEHTNKEYLNLDEWQNTLNVAREWLSKENLPKFILPDLSIEDIKFLED